MRFVAFYQSLVSDWNHGNAHFLRGVVRELLRRGHQVTVHEPLTGWSRSNLIAEYGTAPLEAFERAYPDLGGVSRGYASAGALDLDDALEGADVVLVHEWSDPDVVRRIGEHRRRIGGYALLFHDTHHRSVTDPEAMGRYDLRWYDGVLAFGARIRDLYLDRGWTQAAWVWHEAADTTVFRPLPGPPAGDLVWIGNWGDDERAAELDEFVVEPVRALGISASVYGVRYPPSALDALARAGIHYRGWLPNFEVPGVFARFRVTVHVPRAPYTTALPGIPTIRPFEALASGIPLVSAPWDDDERLFEAGTDYLVARNGAEMRRQLAAVLGDAGLAARLSAAGRRTIAARHTTAHRVNELLEIVNGLEPAIRRAPPVGPRGMAKVAS
jgi:spore maturation protein CgeB